MEEITQNNIDKKLEELNEINLKIIEYKSNIDNKNINIKELLELKEKSNLIFNNTTKFLESLLEE